MKRKGLAIILSLCMLLCACSGNGKSTQDQIQELTDIKGDEKESVAGTEDFVMGAAIRIVEKSMPDADDALQDYLPENGSYREILWDMSKDTVYRFVMILAQEGWTEGYCLQRMESPYESWECQTMGLTDWLEDGTECYVRQASFDGDGNLQLLLADSGEVNYYWAKWTPESGFTVPAVKIEGSLINADMLSSNKKWYIDNEQRAYLYFDQEFEYYDADFTSVEYGSNAMRGMFRQVTKKDENVYVCGNDSEDCFAIWDALTGKRVFSSNVLGNMHPNGKVIFASDDEAYLCNPTELSRFSLAEGKEEVLLEFSREGYPLSRVYAGTVKEDGTLALLAKVNNKTMLLEIPGEPVQSTGEELEVAMLYASPFFRELVVDFNKKNADYTVVLRTPKEFGDWNDWNDFRNRVRTEVGSGGGPDLLDAYLLDIEEAARKGFLKDMTDYCASDRDRIWEAAWITGEVDGKNYEVPYKCRFWTLVAGEELVGKRTTWTLEEMEQCFENVGCSMALGSLDQGVLEGESAFCYFGIFSKSRGGLIDWDNGISYLSDEAAVSLMEAIKQHPYTGREEEQGIKIAEGDIPAVMAVVGDRQSLQCLAALFQNREVYIGFPVEPEEKGGFLSSDGFVVNQASEKTEAIEAFLSYLLSEEVQQLIAQKSVETMMVGGLPVDKKAMDSFYNYALEGEYVDEYFSGINSFYGYQYTNAVLTEESVNKFREAFENAGPMPDAEMVFSIIGDEALAYFDGNKSAQEAADAMHNRVQLYLEEMK